MEELFLNGQKIDLEGNSISRNIQNISLIGDFRLKSDYTNRLRIPKTSNNVRVMEYLGINGNTSPFKFGNLSAIYKINGLNAITNGVAKVLGDVPTTKDRIGYYEIAIYSGVYTLYEATIGKSLKDLNMSSYNHTFNVANVRGYFGATEGITYPMGMYRRPKALKLSDTSSYFTIRHPSSYGSGADKNELKEDSLLSMGNIFHDDGVDYAIRIEEMQLMFYEHTLVKKILEDAGFTYTFPFFDSEEFTSILITSDKGMYTDIGDSVNVNSLLPDINQWEFLSNVFRTYGIVYKEIDSNSILGSDKILEFKKIDDMIVETADDWSDKLSQEISNTYTTKFNRSYNLRYLDGTDYDFSFDIENDKASVNEGDYLRSIFPEATDGFLVSPTTNSEEISVFDAIDYKDGEYIPRESVKPHRFKIRFEERNYGFATYAFNGWGFASYVLDTYNEEVPEITFRDLEMNSIASNHHSNQIAAVRNAYEKEVLLKLNEIDIHSFDILKPKYFKQLGGNFIIQSINNFTGRGLTKCNLVKVGEADDTSYTSQNSISITDCFMSVHPFSITLPILSSLPFRFALNLNIRSKFPIKNIDLVDTNNRTPYEAAFAYSADFNSLDPFGFYKYQVNTEDWKLEFEINKSGSYLLKARAVNHAGQKSQYTLISITIP